jgi:hypothetical protein
MRGKTYKNSVCCILAAENYHIFHSKYKDKTKTLADNAGFAYLYLQVVVNLSGGLVSPLFYCLNSETVLNVERKRFEK